MYPELGKADESVKVKVVAVEVIAPFRVVSNSKIDSSTPPIFCCLSCLNLTASPVEKL